MFITTMFLRSMFTGAVLAALVTTPASAAVELEAPLKPCYVAAQENQRELITVAAKGFTPLSKVDVVIDETDPVTVDALIDGRLQGTIQAPFVESGEREFTLRLTERGSTTNTITAVSRVTRFMVEQSPRSAKTHDRVRFKGRGFTIRDKITQLPLPVYAHYVFGGKSLKTVKVGMPKGSCGTFNVRRRQFPFKRRPRVGTWTIQFDQLPYYDPNAAVKVPMPIKVKRTIKPRSSRSPRSSS